MPYPKTNAVTPPLPTLPFGPYRDTELTPHSQCWLWELGYRCTVGMP